MCFTKVLSVIAFGFGGFSCLSRKGAWNYDHRIWWWKSCGHCPLNHQYCKHVQNTNLHTNWAYIFRFLPTLPRMCRKRWKHSYMVRRRCGHDLCWPDQSQRGHEILFVSQCHIFLCVCRFSYPRPQWKILDWALIVFGLVFRTPRPEYLGGTTVVCRFRYFYFWYDCLLQNDSDQYQMYAVCTVSTCKFAYDQTMIWTSDIVKTCQNTCKTK